MVRDSYGCAAVNQHKCVCTCDALWASLSKEKQYAESYCCYVLAEYFRKDKHLSVCHFFHLEWDLFLLAVCSSIHHILDHVLTYGIETERVTVFPENPPWSDHFLITFALTIMHYKAVGNPFHYSRCLSESALANFNSSAVIFLNVPPQWIPLPLRSVIVIVLHLYSLRLDTVAYLKTKPQSVLFI